MRIQQCLPESFFRHEVYHLSVHLFIPRHYELNSNVNQAEFDGSANGLFHSYTVLIQQQGVHIALCQKQSDCM
jgi:hypothetical protein